MKQVYWPYAGANRFAPLKPAVAPLPARSARTSSTIRRNFSAAGSGLAAMAAAMPTTAPATDPTSVPAAAAVATACPRPAVAAADSAPVTPSFLPRFLSPTRTRGSTEVPATQPPALRPSPVKKAQSQPLERSWHSGTEGDPVFQSGTSCKGANVRTPYEKADSAVARQLDREFSLHEACDHEVGDLPCRAQCSR